MKVESKVRHLTFFFIFFINIVFLSAESFRVSKVHTADVDSTPGSEVDVKLGINDSLAITLPDDMEYIEGIELKFLIPDVIASWMDSVGCSIYLDIRPTPKSSQIDYNGTRVFFRTLPNKLSWVLQIPVKYNNSLKSNNYTQKLNRVLNPKDKIIFVRLQPVMKGVPEETLNAIIPITVKPLFENEGKLELNLKDSHGDLQPCSIFVDDEMIDVNSNEDILLPTGVHDISIISEYYRNELRTIRIDQARKTKVVVEMKSIAPTLLVSAPEGTAVYLDDVPCNTLEKEFEIEEGEHKVKFVIGNYEMVRNINAIKGKTYKAVFSLDLQITEE